MTGKPSFDKILFGLSLLVAVLSTGLVYYSHNMIEKPTIDGDKSFKEMAISEVDKLDAQRLILDEIVVNLYSRKTRLRFLNLKMGLELFNSDQNQLVKSYTPLINDIVVDVAGNMRFSEINSVTGKILFESRIKKRLNKLIGASLIKKIYFSKFIIQ